jgi:hypothetical protein
VIVKKSPKNQNLLLTILKKGVYMLRKKSSLNSGGQLAPEKFRFFQTKRGGQYPPECHKFFSNIMKNHARTITDEVGSAYSGLSKFKMALVFKIHFIFLRLG